VQRLWGSITDSAPADTALKAFLAGLTAAVDMVHNQHGRVIQVTWGQTPHWRPVNGWYNTTCMQAREAYTQALHEHGYLSAQARDARRQYRRQVGRAKREHEAASRQQLVRDLYQNPRSFWRAYRGRPAAHCGNTQQWTEHFKGLFGANTAGEYAGGSFDKHCETYRDLFPNPTTLSIQQAARLNEPITDSELQLALGKLECDKAAGVDGIPAEFLQQAFVQAEGQSAKREYILGPVLKHVFNAVLRGQYPEAWQVSALVPVPKPKGRADVFDDYRGIAVSAVLSKLFSIVMMARLDTWAEKQGLRAAGQAGFRAGRGTPDNCFVLRHLIDAAAIKKKPLYCAFIDFSKAYDRVDRKLLWAVLRGCGLHGPMLQAIMHMYEVTKLQVRAQAELGEPFEATVGVKQGCPISPLFFGILIDRLEAHLQRKCPDAGAQLAAHVLRALLYADDVVLTADTPQGLQDMLRGLESFCAANSMFVNLGKSAVVVFNRRWHSSAMQEGLTFLYNGAPLPVESSYVYLGLKFEDGQPARAALGGAVTKAKKALMAMFGRCYKLGAHNVDLQGHLFDTIVKPVLCYGCEIWAVDWVSAQCHKGFDFTSGRAEVEVHKPFMRQSLGVGTSTTTAVMMKELNRQPMSVFWLCMATKLWNRALHRPEGDLLRMAMLENVSMATQDGLSAANRKRLWAHHFIACLEKLGIAWADPDGNPLQIDTNAVGKLMLTRWESREWKAVEEATNDGPPWMFERVSVRAAPASFSRGFKQYTYQTWFAVDEWVRKETWMYHLHTPERIRAMAQFRLGSHWLAIQQARFQGVPRHQRCCAHCAGKVEDELHMLECPLYSDLRARFAVPTWTEDMSDIGISNCFTKQNDRDWNRLAEFLAQCKRLRCDSSSSVPLGYHPADMPVGVTVAR
jgi:hypothetical protein